ncbi:MAG: hypothetical protein ACP5HG_01060 [Anaerolineae bacterium]
MTTLCGKGIWLAHSYDLERAVEFATRINGTHLLIKVGHGPHYFAETTREAIQRVRTLGLSAVAWVQLTNVATADASKAIVESLSRGYEAAVLYLADTHTNIGEDQMAALAEALVRVEIPRERLFLASPPFAYLPDQAAVEALVSVCQGGWMPLCFAAWGSDAEQTIDRDVYHELGDLSLLWGKTPQVYPVLSPHFGLNGDEILPENFIPWIEGVTRHGVDFFSIYHAANTEKVLWPMLEAVNVGCLETDGRAALSDERADMGLSAVPQPMYITAKTSDTVWGIISRHSLNREQFWAWNAHLWDSRGLPRDPDYLQEGWRIRVK